MYYDDFLDPQGNQFQQEQLRELPPRYTFMDGMETVIEQNWREYGALRPHRFLPALYTSLQDQEGYVIPHGTIVASVNIKDYAGNYQAAAGLDSSGYFPTGIGFSGTLTASVKSIYGYDRTMDGVIVPFNGSTASINDYITQYDVDIKRVKQNGVQATAADVGSAVAIARPVNSFPVGILGHQVMRETQGSNLSYRLSTEAYSVVRYGVLHVPYILAGAATILNPAKGSDAGYAAVYWRHQFLLVQDTAQMNPGNKCYVDGNGKLILPTTPSNFPVPLGRIFSWTNEPFTDLMSRVDGFPGLNVPGTNTGGLTRRLFDLISKVRAANGLTVDIKSVQNEVVVGNYGMVKIIVQLDNV